MRCMYLLIIVSSFLSGMDFSVDSLMIAPAAARCRSASGGGGGGGGVSLGGSGAASASSSATAACCTAILSPWKALNPESLVSAPCLLEQTLCEASDDQPQLAKDKNYAQAVLDAWRMEESQSVETVWDNTEYCRIQYMSGDGTTPLYGYLIQQKRGQQQQPEQQAEQRQQEQSLRPGVVLFHTGAGPHDLFLLYKAASLVHSLRGAGGVLVMISDLLSDESGWAWDTVDDRSRYKKVTDQLLVMPRNDPDDKNKNHRWLLRERVQAALETLQQQLLLSGRNEEDEDNEDNALVVSARPQLACLGWCLGGHSILEVAKLQQNDIIRALVTFHGVFDGAAAATAAAAAADTATNRQEQEEQEKATTTTTTTTPTQVLICHGTSDPYCSKESLEQALSLLEQCHCRTSLLQLANAKHGFTNPAQAYHENPAAFGFDAVAANKAWKQTVNLLRRTLTTSEAATA